MLRTVGIKTPVTSLESCRSHSALSLWDSKARVTCIRHVFFPAGNIGCDRVNPSSQLEYDMLNSSGTWEGFIRQALQGKIGAQIFILRDASVSQGFQEGRCIQFVFRDDTIYLSKSTIMFKLL